MFEILIFLTYSYISYSIYLSNRNVLSIAVFYDLLPIKTDSFYSEATEQKLKKTVVIIMSIFRNTVWFLKGMRESEGLVIGNYDL